MTASLEMWYSKWGYPLLLATDNLTAQEEIIFKDVELSEAR